MDMKFLIRKYIYKTMYKNIDETKLSVLNLHIKKENIFYFSLSSNTIMSFTYAGKHYYFRECPQLFRKNDYIKHNIDSILKSASQINIKKEHFSQELPIKTDFSLDTVLEFSEYIHKLSQNISFINKMFNAYNISQKNHFNIWEKQIYTRDFFEEYGLNNLPDNFQDIAIYFLWCMRNISFNYRTLYIASGKKYSHFSATKSIASRIVAEELGMKHMITSAEYCNLKLEDGTIVFGVLSLAAEGARMIDSKIKLTGFLQKELLNMNILDLICFQTDHGMNNYNIIEYGEQCKICAFDNDNPNTFLPYPMIKDNFLGCSSIISSDGLLNRPYIDRTTVDNLLNIDIEILKNRLTPYLNKLQICALLKRIHKIQKMIEKTVAQKPECIITNDEWNELTIKEELCGSYGKTYLTIVAERNCISELA